MPRDFSLMMFLNKSLIDPLLTSNNIFDNTYTVWCVTKAYLPPEGRWFCVEGCWFCVEGCWFRVEGCWFYVEGCAGSVLRAAGSV